MKAQAAAAEVKQNRCARYCDGLPLAVTGLEQNKLHYYIHLYTQEIRLYYYKLQSGLAGWSEYAVGSDGVYF
jgi:hypothetical protein